MDALTHFCLPLLVAYAVRPALFSTPRYLVLAGGGLLADVDKLLGVPGLLHSLVTLVPICLGLIVAERVRRQSLHYSVIASLFVLSHPVFDLLEGGPVPLLFPVVRSGLGVVYSLDVVFGTGPFGVAFRGWPLGIEVDSLRTGHTAAAVDTNRYGFLDGFGVASLLALVVTVASRTALDSRGPTE